MIWDSKTAEPLGVVPTAAPALCGVLAADGRTLAYNVKDQVHLVDLVSSETRHVLQSTDEYINTLVISPDSKLLAVYAREEVAVYDIDSGEKKFHLPTYDVRPRPDMGLSQPFHFDAENRLLCIGSVAQEKNRYGKALVRLSSDGSDVEQLLEITGSFPTVSPDGKLLAAWTHEREPNSLYGVQVWDVETKELTHTFDGHIHQVYNFEFSPDNKLLASAAVDGEVKIWDLSK